MSSSRGAGFAKVPADVLALGNGYAIAVYAAIAKHADREGVAFPSVKTLSEITGWSHPTVNRAIVALVDAGVLIKERRFRKGMNRANEYRLPFHTVKRRSTGDHTAKSPEPQIETSLPTENRYETSFRLVRNDVSLGTQPRFQEQDSVEQDSEEEREATADAAAPARSPSLSQTQRKSTRSTEIDPAFEPRPEDVQQLQEELGISDTVIRFETAKFIDHYRSKEETRKDWSAAWRLWIRRSGEFTPNGSASGAAAQNGTPKTLDEIRKERGITEPIRRDEDSPLWPLIQRQREEEEGIPDRIRRERGIKEPEWREEDSPLASLRDREATHGDQ